ncbi:MAG: hypothetical protein H6622_07105 [Halobacteriovoraceae bacterium]|nr:hypothetical protein [Halobacteriovoraceae bacterium]
MKLALLGQCSQISEIYKFLSENTIYVSHFHSDQNIEDQSLYIKQIDSIPLSIGKRYLKKEEVILNRTRLADLFRVHYEVIPCTSNFASTIQDNEHIFNSLQETYETYEDFDIVISLSSFHKAPVDLRGNHLGVLNERKFRFRENVKSIGQLPSSITNLLEHSTKLIIVGNDPHLKEIEDDLIEWIKKSKKHIVTILSQEGQSCLDKLLRNSFQIYEDEINKYEESVFKWRELADFEKAKILKPIEPVNQVQHLIDLIPVSLDELIDRKECFLTCEEKNIDQIGATKTIPYDQVIIANGKEYGDDFFKSLNYNNKKQVIQEEEPGLYFIDLNQELKGQLEEVLLDLQRYFRRKN